MGDWEKINDMINKALYAVEPDDTKLKERIKFSRGCIIPSKKLLDDMDAKCRELGFVIKNKNNYDMWKDTQTSFYWWSFNHNLPSIIKKRVNIDIPIGERLSLQNILTLMNNRTKDDKALNQYSISGNSLISNYDTKELEAYIFNDNRGYIMLESTTKTYKFYSVSKSRLYHISANDFLQGIEEMRKQIVDERTYQEANILFNMLSKFSKLITSYYYKEVEHSINGILLLHDNIYLPDTALEIAKKQGVVETISRKY